jgi:molybdopterin molybdotransferase
MTSPDSELISVSRAIEIIDAEPAEAVEVGVPSPEAMGLRLARDVTADRPYPPFDKSLVDGFAVRSADTTPAPAALRVVGEIAAGGRAARPLVSGETMAIMTGAPVPDRADAVVMVEETRPLDAGAGNVGRDIANPALPSDSTARAGSAASADSTAPAQLGASAASAGTRSTGTFARGGLPGSVFILRSAKPGQNIARRGSDIQAGATVLRAGMAIGPAQAAVLATVGAASVRVFAAPTAAILATGDELAQAGQTPAEEQIRNSNSILLQTLLWKLGCAVRDLGVCGDNPEHLRAAILAGLDSDLLFVTGGMSMGRHDHVPRLLKELGVEIKIAKLRIRPGKPFVFGVKRRAAPEAVTPETDSAPMGVFIDPTHAGHEAADPTHAGREAADPNHAGRDIVDPTHAGSDPGDPVDPIHATSDRSYVFGLPGNPVSGYVCALRLASRLIARLGGGAPAPLRRTTLLQPVAANGAREFYQPAIIGADGVRPVDYKGSADVFALAQANALIVRPEFDEARPPGATVDVLEMP